MSQKKLLGQRVKRLAPFLEAKVPCFHRSHLVFMSISIGAFSFKSVSLFSLRVSRDIFPLLL